MGLLLMYTTGCIVAFQVKYSERVCSVWGTTCQRNYLKVNMGISQTIEYVLLTVVCCTMSTASYHGTVWVGSGSNLQASCMSHQCHAACLMQHDIQYGTVLYNIVAQVLQCRPGRLVLQYCSVLYFKLLILILYQSLLQYLASWSAC